MKRITYFVALVLAVCCGLSAGYKTSPSAHDITFATNTLRPTLTASPTPVYAPQNAAMEETPMNIEPRDLLSLIAALSGLAAVVISLLAFFRANPQATPAQLDERAAASLEDLQKNRAAMEAYEVAFQKQSDNFKMAFDTLTMFARMLAGMVPSKTMQEAADTLADIKTPGAPDQPVRSDLAVG